METIYYIGLDVHKKTIAYCIKTVGGKTMRQGVVSAERNELRQWLADLPGPWMGAMEATIFTGWIYDFLKPHAVELKVAHPEMLKAITAAKKKNDRADAEKFADLLRVNLLPECTMMSEELRELRRHPALPESGGSHCHEDEKQDVRSADGSRGDLRQTAIAWTQVFRRTAGTGGGCAGIGQGSAAIEPWQSGDVYRRSEEADQNVEGGSSGTLFICSLTPAPWR